jgi:transcriptional regulator with XRE-family HTH domain
MMRTRTRNFPGTDHKTSEQLALDVARDEEAIINAMLEIRRTNPMSLEAIAFLLGTDPSQISRYLKGNSSVTLTNYLRIARALGYRCRIVLEVADTAGSGDAALSDLKIASHKVCNARRSPAS